MCKYVGPAPSSASGWSPLRLRCGRNRLVEHYIIIGTGRFIHVTRDTTSEEKLLHRYYEYD